MPRLRHQDWKMARISFPARAKVGGSINMLWLKEREFAASPFQGLRRLCFVRNGLAGDRRDDDRLQGLGHPADDRVPGLRRGELQGKSISREWDVVTVLLEVSTFSSRKQCMDTALSPSTRRPCSSAEAGTTGSEDLLCLGLISISIC